MSTVITICKKVIKVVVVKIKSFQKLPQPKNQTHLNPNQNTLLPLLRLKTIRTIWRNMHKSKMSMDWTVSLDPHSISAMMAPQHQQHPSPTVRRDIVVIKDQVHIHLVSFFPFTFDFSFTNASVLICVCVMRVCRCFLSTVFVCLVVLFSVVFIFDFRVSLFFDFGSVCLTFVC